MLSDFKTYEDLISNAKKEFRQKGGHVYYELHHILPKNMGGSDEKENLVLLTIGEHVYAHYLLALECEQNKNHQGYVANIQAAWLVCHGKSKFSNWKKIKLEEWLMDEEAQKISAELKIKFLENKKNEKGPNAGKTLKINDRIWVQKATQKPVRIRERNFGQGSWIGYIKIVDCPICHQANSETSFACCEAHAEEYLKLKKEEYKKQRALDVAKRWEDPEYAKRISEANTGIAHGSTGIWITNGIDTKMIQESELEKYTNQGWSRGRSNIQGYAQTEEYKQKLSERRKNSCYVKKDGVVKEIKLDELDKYLSEGWTRGTYGTSRKGIIQPPMAWVHNETEIKRIRKTNLQEYLDNGWKQGRK
jgi:hypothetical protein